VLDAYSDLPLFNTKAVVHQTGVPAPTLRAWERRYGILSPRRGENDYRLYSERDMMMVTWLRERVESGMTISQAIALLRSLEPTRRRGRRGKPAAAPAQAAASPSAAMDCFALDGLVEALFTQFAGLDEAGARRTVAQALAVHPVEEVCLGLFAPVLHEIGHRWAASGLGFTIEHFALAVIRAQLEGLYHSMLVAEQGPLVLVGCAPGELHEIGPLMLALFLRRAGVHVAYLGQDCEPEALVAAVAALKPAYVLLSASQPTSARALAAVGQRLRALPPPPPSLGFGGKAFAQAPELTEAIPGQYLNGDLRQAIMAIKRGLAA
jgi:methanogenic corrinoid protein MtbC1